VNRSPVRIGVVAVLLSSASLPLLSAKTTLSDAELAKELQKIREYHAPHLAIERESSVLGKLPDGAEAAATHVDLREVYMSRPLRELSAEEKTRALRQYRAVTFFLNRRSGPGTFALGTAGAQLRELNNECAVTVMSVEPNGPAAKALKTGDLIIGAYGHLFEERRDPRVPLGYALADAKTEAREGKLVLDLVRDGEVLQITIELGVQGAYRDTWPSNCPKSEAIRRKVLRNVLDAKGDTGVAFWWDGLFLAGMDDHEALELVRRSAYGLAKRKNLGYGGLNSWWSSYALASLCEYYLLTGDSVVLGSAAKLVEVLEKGQMTCGSWSHGCPPGGYGAVNQVGSVCYMGLVLAREAGVEVDREVLLRSIRFFGKGVGACMPYGDHTVTASHYHGAAYNGMNATMAITLFILGAEDLARWTARPIGYAYRNRLHGHGARMFAMAWGAVGAHLATEPEFNLYMNSLVWHYELMLRREGSLQGLAPMGSTSRLGMAYALPKQKLRVFGAPKGVFGVRPPAGLTGIADLFRDKKWGELVAALEKAKPADERGRQYVAGLKAAYKCTEEHYQASLTLIEDNIKAGKQWRAKQQLDALVTFIGEERDAMKALAAKIEDPVKPRRAAGRRDDPPPARPKVHLWDIQLQGGEAAEDAHYVYGVDKDHPEPDGDWTAADYQPTGWQEVSGGKGQVRPARTLLVRREFVHGKTDDLPKGFSDAAEDEEDEADRLLDGAGQKPVKKVPYTTVCLAIESNASGDIFLNGVRIASFARANDPGTRRFDLGEKALGLLKLGRNVLAARLSGCGTGPARMIKVALGPSGPDGVEIPSKSPFEEGGGGRNGWNAPRERFHEDCRWFFTDKSAKECARFLNHPVFTVIDEAAAAIARQGKAALPLVKELIGDQHPGIRMGGWDVAMALHRAGALDEGAAGELLALAANAEKDALVMQSVAKALAAFKIESEAAHAIALAMAESKDPGTRSKAVMMFSDRGGFMKDPVAAIKVGTAAAKNWEGNDARIFGFAWQLLKRHVERPEAREAIPAIALVLDNVAHHLRGMFSNGVMTGCMPVLDRYLDAETEKTPHLISGLLKCYIKVPKSDWPGWPIAQRAVKGNVYRLSPAVAERVVEVVKEQQQWLDTAPPVQMTELGGEGTRKPMQTVIDELAVWGQALGKLGKGQDDGVLLALADSENPLERKVAVSAAWAGRCEDPKTAIKVATAVIDHVEGNDSRHYAFAGQVLSRHLEMKEVRAAVPAIGKALDRSLHDSREWQTWYAQKDLLPVLQKHVDKDNEMSPGLVAGVVKCAVKAAPEWRENEGGDLGTAYLNVAKKFTPAAAGTMKRTEEKLQKWYAKAKNDGREMVRIFVNYHWAKQPPGRDRTGRLMDGRGTLEGRMGEIAALVQVAIRDKGEGVIKLNDDEMLEQLEKLEEDP